MSCQGCNQWTTWTLVSVRKVLKETSNSTIKSLPFFLDNCSFVWTTGCLFSTGADTDYHNECALLRGAEQGAKRDELGWIHTLWTMAANTVNIHQLQCFPYIHLHVGEGKSKARLSREKLFLNMKLLRCSIRIALKCGGKEILDSSSSSCSLTFVFLPKPTRFASTEPCT